MIDDKCLHCERFGVSCSCSNFIEMTPEELLEYWKIRKKILGYTNKDISVISTVPIGTVDRVFTGKNPDFQYKTSQPITIALLPKGQQKNGCEEPFAGKSKELEERNKELEEENQELKDIIVNIKKSTIQKQNRLLMAAAYFAPWILFITVWLFSK